MIVKQDATTTTAETTADKHEQSRVIFLVFDDHSSATATNTDKTRPRVH